MKKFTAALLIFMVICSFVINDGVKKSYAIAPALGPAVYYGLGSLIVASGVYAGTSDDLDYLVSDYWNKASSSIKNLWKNTAIYAGTAGYLLVNQSMIEDMTKYLTTDFEVTQAIEECAMPDVTYPSAVSTYMSDKSSVFSLTDGSVMMMKPINRAYDSYNSLYYDQIGFDFLFLSKTFNNSNWEYWRYYLNALSPHCMPGTIPQIWYISSTATSLTFGYSYIEYVNGDVVTGTKTINVAFAAIASLYGQIVNGEWSIDPSGIGTTIAPEDEIKVPCPPIPEIDWPETWLDELEKSLNEADNPFVDDETTIQEGKEEWDWWIDEWGNPYKVRKGEPPRDPQKDKKIGFPIPMPEPNIPDEFPDINNPEETVIEYPPETTSTQNPDGTRTDTTTQTTTTTRRWYDPDTEKWKETTTTTTTTTQQDYDPDGMPIGPPRTVVTTPDGPVKTSPPDKDADKIDWQPLKIGIGAITHKFPFSLPWDIYNSFSQFSGTSWDGEFDINIDTILADWVFTIDLSMWENIISIVKKVELMFFDIGLILATRRLMGGGV